MKVKIVTMTEGETILDVLVFAEKVSEKAIVKYMWESFLEGLADEPSPFPETVEAFNELGSFDIKVELKNVLEEAV